MLKSYLSKIMTLALLVGMSVGAFAQNLTITSPTSIAGDYPVRPSQLFGPAFTNISGELVLADDGTMGDTNGDGNLGTINDGCEMIMNDVAGKIALIDRGECGFVIKAQSAQDAGAIAVIICNNNVAAPNNLQYMGGVDPGTLTIPTAMLSYNNCLTIKGELANGPVMGNTVVAADGESCETAWTAVEGVNMAPAASGGGSLFNTSVSGLFYKFTPTADALMTVSSCGSILDTWAYILGDGCDVLTVINQNDDCDFTNGDYGSTLVAIVHAGVEYVIYWDDANTIAINEPFDWTLTLDALPSVDVTFQVDMQDQTVAPGGVRISINGGAETNMTDGGNGIWSYTASFTAGTTVNYAFFNGAGNAENSPEIADCRSIVPGLDASTTPLVCYNSCSACPPDVACPNWISDDFEAYNLGGLSVQSADWGPWTPGSITEDAIVSDEQAQSGVHSMKISEANADDQLLLLGNRTTGHFILKWKMYIPTGSAGYYNIQKNQNTPGTGDAFANEVNFLADGTGTYAVGNVDIPFTFPHDVWFTVMHDIDLDNNINTVIYDGQLIDQHPANWQAGSEAGITQLGGVDFYGAAGVLYYVDDVLLKQIEACPAKSLICDGFDGYDNGLVGPQSPWWTGWTQVDGGADDGEVNSDQFLSCEQALKVSAAPVAANSDDIILLLGNRPTGNYTLSWNMYVPTGSQGYYNIQKDTDKLPANAGTADYAMEVYFNAAGAGAVSAGGANSSTFTYEYDTWFNVEHKIDLDNNTASVWIDGVKIQDWLPSWDYLTQTAGGVKQLGGVDFYGAPNVLYYVDDVRLIEETPLLQPAIPVTFQVDMTWEIQQGMPVAGVKIAGNFTTNGAAIPDWTPPSSPAFTAIGGDIYEVTIEFPATSVGQTLQYKFLNTATSWGDCGDEQECFTAFGSCTTDSNPDDINRALVIPADATTFCYTYNTCEDCNLPNATTEIVEIPMTIAPNPFSSRAIVTFNSPIINGQARLTTLTGQMVRNYRVEGTQLTIMKNELVPGIYFLNVVTENGISAAEKLIVQ